MSILINTSTGKIISEDAFKALHKSTVFPERVSPKAAAMFGYAVVKEGTKPDYDSVYQEVVSTGITQVGDNWVKEWEVRTKADAADCIRAERDSLLAACDWVVTKNTEKGTNIPAEWEIYRQALRDIPQQEGFPNTVTWPVKP